jgi:hypothetical protein
MAVVERYQQEFIDAAKDKGIKLNVQLRCTTFPQARCAVSAGYAAILPTNAFSDEELRSVRKLDLPLDMPTFNTGEASVSIVWNKRLEEVMENCHAVLKAFRSVLGKESESN